MKSIHEKYYKGDQAIGVWKFYRENGTVFQEVFWDKAIVNYYDEEGKITKTEKLEE